MGREKNTGKIEALPLRLKLQINKRLRAGGKDAEYRALAEWLFGAADDESIPCSARWLGGDGDAARERGLHACENALHRWFKGPFKRWKREEDKHDEDLRFTENVEEKYELLGDDADRRVLRSLLLEVAPTIRSDESSPGDKATAYAVISREIERQRKSRREDRKLALLEKKFAEAEKVSQDEKLTPAERDARYKEIFGMR